MHLYETACPWSVYNIRIVLCSVFCLRMVRDIMICLIVALLDFLPSLGEFFDMIISFFGHFRCGGVFIISSIVAIILFLYYLKKRKKR